MAAVGHARVPWVDRDSPWLVDMLLWDGRLDNRRELEHSVQLPYYDSPPDAGVVLAAYDQWGIPGLARAIGDWSLVICDRRNGALVLASDYAGVRPLYYHVDGKRVLWSLHLALLAATLRIDELEERWVRSFLERGGAAHWTPFKGIHIVPAGHAVRVSAAGIDVERFWTPPLTARVRYSDVRDYDAHLRQLFRDAVEVRLRSAAPVVAALSGGLDSSSVVCMANSLIRG